jgi:hypothetical protein
MNRRIGSLLIVVLIVANLFLAANTFAHQMWRDGKYYVHWNRSGTSVTFNLYNGGLGSDIYDADKARADWHNNTILNLYWVDSTAPRDITVYSYNSQDGRGGLYYIWWDTKGHIYKGEAAYNLYYGQNKQGVFCQEIGHNFGLEHSNDGCMGYTYWNSLITTVQHNWTDIYNWYRYPHQH